MHYYLGVWIGFRMVLKKGWKPDLIHAHVFFAGVSSVILGKSFKIPVVITEHFSVFLKKNFTFLDRRKAKFSLNGAKIILPVSQNLQRAIKEFGIENNFKVIPNAVNSNLFHLQDEGKFNKSETDLKRMLFVGSIWRAKGIEYLFEALSLINRDRNDFHLDMIGQGSEDYISRKLAEMGLENRVSYHGTKTKEQVSEFMRSCDFYVQPSLVETFGVTYIEAMACGKPVIGTQIPSLQEIITEENGILVPPRNVELLVAAISYMLDHYQYYPAAKISSDVNMRYSYEAVGILLNDVYTKVTLGKT